MIGAGKNIHKLMHNTIFNEFRRELVWMGFRSLAQKIEIVSFMRFQIFCRKTVSRRSRDTNKKN